MNSNLFSAMYNRIKKKTDNRGSSIVLVIVSLAFIGMLVAMAVYMSYYNYLMKINDRESKENFYSAEEALAEINAGLQTVVSNSMATAYTYALQNSTEDNMNLRQTNFELEYKSQLIKAVMDTDETHYKIDLLESYLRNTKYDDNKGYGAKLMTGVGENTVFEKEGGIVLQNVKLMYTDQNGYVTILSTDIRLRLPQISLTSTAGVPELENCSLIANNNLKVESNNNIKVSGNVYGGKDGLIASNDTKLTFQKKDTDANIVYRLVAGSINVENSTGSDGETLSVTEDYEVWTENIDITSGRIALDGSVYVQDDLTIGGRDSKVTLGGSYYGYGDELYQSKGSSAILVNGANTTLDFSRLESLTLAGHAYIGARHYDVNSTDADDYIEDLDDENEDENNAEEEQPEDEQEEETEDTYEKNDKDLMMGESVGVKSNQLVYLVPTECIGYYNDSSTRQYLAKNPMSYDEYLTLTQTYQYELDDKGEVVMEDGVPKYKLDEDGNKIPTYLEVNMGILTKKLGKSLSSYGANYKPVFRRVNGTVLVYYYLEFTSDVAANQFFADYYEADRENMDEYIKTYINRFNVNPNLNVAQANLHLAGNMVKFDNNNNPVLVKDTLTADALVAEELSENRYKWADTYTAYSKKMMSSTSLLTSEQLMNDIYENLVIDDLTFNGIVPNGYYQIYESGNVKALAVNNKDKAAFNLNDANEFQDVYVIIATGDVVVNRNFKGLIIAGGSISLAPNCNVVQSEAAKVRQAMMAKAGDNKFADLLLDGIAYTTVGATADGDANDTPEAQIEQQIQREEDYVDISELIVYENWTKQ